MILIKHWEDDGFTGSYEPYYECPNKCDTTIDTCTEFGEVDIEDLQQIQSIIL